MSCKKDTNYIQSLSRGELEKKFSDKKIELAQTKAAHENTKIELAQTKAAHEDTKIELAQRMFDLEYVKNQFSTLQRFAFGQTREKYVPIPI